MLSQSKHPIAFFNKKLTGPHLNYGTYDVELMVVVKSLQYWRHCLISKEFMLYSDHEALKCIHGQQKLSARHAKWVN